MTDHDRAALERFRAGLYHGVLGQRRDALFEVLDAVLGGAGPAPVVRCSLAPCFRRAWPSACDAVADGTLRVRSLGFTAFVLVADTSVAVGKKGRERPGSFTPFRMTRCVGALAILVSVLSPQSSV